MACCRGSQSEDCKLIISTINKSVVVVVMSGHLHLTVVEVAMQERDLYLSLCCPQMSLLSLLPFISVVHTFGQFVDTLSSCVLLEWVHVRYWICWGFQWWCCLCLWHCSVSVILLAAIFSPTLDISSYRTLLFKSTFLLMISILHKILLLRPSRDFCRVCVRGQHSLP